MRDAVSIGGGRKNKKGSLSRLPGRQEKAAVGGRRAAVFRSCN
jgi:hypothetical protein